MAFQAKTKDGGGPRGFQAPTKKSDTARPITTKPTTNANRPHRSNAAVIVVLLLMITMAGTQCLSPPHSRACSIARSAQHPIDKSIDDQTPPSAIQNVSVSISRGVGPQSNGCTGSQSSSSCDDVGFIRIEPRGSVDDVGADQDIGYVIELTSGTLPGEITVPTEPIQAPLNLVWHDEAKDNQEPIKFTLRLTPIDRAGNLGPTSEPIRVSDPGSSFFGCHQTSGHAQGQMLIWFMLGGAILVVRRRFFAPSR